MEKNTGVPYALAAYGSWGVLPLFWKLLSDVPPLQIVAHRLLWSFVFVGLLAVWKGQAGSTWKIITQREKVWPFAASSLILTSNWLLYVWAVNSGHIVESSMGYFINPLVNVFLGMVFLREKINLWQGISILLAGSGVLYMVIGYGQFPWIAVSLAVTFGFYGLIRKIVPAESLTGLMVETALLFPLAFVFLLQQGIIGQGAFWVKGETITLLLMAAGVVTAYPLIWLVTAAKQLPLKTLGFCQYLSPTLMLIIGVLVYHEPFTPSHRISFGLIWAAILLYSISSAGLVSRATGGGSITDSSR